jgi:Ca2+-binding RTX toxin-like protein
VIVGFGGNDVIRSRGEWDAICAGDGDDVVYISGRNTHAKGGPGDDILYGGSGWDALFAA